MRVLGVIPARMASSRFPGKPLQKICGLSMIEHVYQRARMSRSLEDVYVATCDEEIQREVRAFGGKAVMTLKTHERASDRVAEALLAIEASCGKFDIVTLIQGDEPMIAPEMIDQAIRPILSDPSCLVTNLMTSVKDRAEQTDPNCVKVVVDKNGFALYFSREPIPSWKMKAAEVPMFKQVCVIAYQRDFLLTFGKLEPTALERVESIDMLRILEHGFRVKMQLTDHDTHSVDTPEDLRLVETLMAKDPWIDKYVKKTVTQGK
jgi:3-deoxy-manno-octulosonate cytidylyltransferase (CMP-KDO synthetase)